MKKQYSLRNTGRNVIPAILVAILVVLSQHEAVAGSVPTAEGTSFLFSVLPSRQAADDSIVVVLRSSSLATVTVNVTSASGKAIERITRIVDSRRAATVSFSRKDIELRGQAADSSQDGGSQAEVVLRSQVVRITADSAVTAVVIGGGSLSSYAMDLVPLNLLGRSHIVAAMPSTVVEADSGKGTTDMSKSGHSQCVIIARDNATTVRLQLKGVTTENTKGEKTIVLQAGEAYMIQASLDTLAENGDLSGTQIIADKPIAVFAGNSNASFPPASGRVAARVQRGSVAQQILPVDRWKRTYALVPVSMTEVGTQKNREWIRIYGSVPTTKVSINGESPVVVEPGGFIEREITQAMHIQASDPVLVMQMVASQNSDNDSTGNAALFTALGPSQWNKTISSNAMQVRQSGAKRYAIQYLTVIADTSAFRNLVIDGQPYDFTPKPIPGSSYGYFIRKVADGTHTVECSSPCGVTMSGVGSLHRYSSPGDIRYPVQPYLLPRFSVPDIEAATGDTVSVRLTLDSLQLPPSIVDAVARSFSFDLCVNASVLTPVSAAQRGIIRDGQQCLRLTYELSGMNLPRDIVTIPMVCGLGDSQQSTIAVQNGVWLSTKGDTIPWQDDNFYGTMTITNVWSDTMGLRLVNPQSGTLALVVGPNPVRTSCVIECSTSDPSPLDARLLVCNGVGESLFEERAALAGLRGKKEVLVDVSTWPPGVYFVRLDRGTESIVTRFLVSR